MRLRIVDCSSLASSSMPLVLQEVLVGSMPHGWLDSGQVWPMEGITNIDMFKASF